MPNPTNGMLILGRWRNAIYVRLPRELQTPVPDGLCRCEYCQKHPKETPSWDTLCIRIPEASNPTMIREPGSVAHTWSVHMPDTAAFFRLAEMEAPKNKAPRR